MSAGTCGWDGCAWNPRRSIRPACGHALEGSGWVPAPHVQPERSAHHRPRSRTRPRSWPACIASAASPSAKSERLGVRVVESGEERLAEFYAIHTDAMRRAGIATRTEAHIPGHVGGARAAGHGPAAVRRGRRDRRGAWRPCSSSPAARGSWTCTAAPPRRAAGSAPTTCSSGRPSGAPATPASGSTTCGACHAPASPSSSPGSAVSRWTTSAPGTWSRTGSGMRVLRVGELGRARFRRWRYRDVHRPDAPEPGEE